MRFTGRELSLGNFPGYYSLRERTEWHLFSDIF